MMFWMAYGFGLGRARPPAGLAVCVGCNNTSNRGLIAAIARIELEMGVSPTKVRKVPQKSL
jgi:hypothetical protein